MPKFSTELFAFRDELFAFAAEHFLVPGRFAFLETSSPVGFTPWTGTRGQPEPWTEHVRRAWVWSAAPDWDRSADGDLSRANANGLHLYLGSLEGNVLTQSWLSAKCTDEASIHPWRAINAELKKITRVGGQIRSCVNRQLYPARRVRYTQAVHRAHLDGLDLRHFTRDGHQYLLHEQPARPW